MILTFMVAPWSYKHWEIKPCVHILVYNNLFTNMEELLYSLEVETLGDRTAYLKQDYLKFM